jgi:hypothetical protein
MLSANPDLTHAQVRTILNRSGATVVTQAGKPVGTFLNSEAAVILAQWLTAVQAWELDGNNIVAGDFLGTRNSMPLEIRVSGILRLIIGTGDPIVSVLGNAWVRNGVETGPRVLAENFAYVEDPLDPRDLEPGDVVCMGPDEDSVVISEQRDDGLVLGVVSSKPGFLLNSALVGGAPMFPIALCGRVLCKVVSENGPIERGDLLASSSTNGRAMKASSVMSVDDPEVPGFKQVEFHRPGTILGKAVGSLQDLAGTGAETGVIEVFVTAR